MAAPVAPVILSPVTGSTFVDPLQPVIVLLDDYVSGDSISLSTLTQYPTQVEDTSATAGLPTWDDEDRLLSAPSGAGDYATSTSPAAMNKVNFRGAAWGTTLDDKEVVGTELRAHVLVDGPTNAGIGIFAPLECNRKHGGSSTFGVTVIDGTTAAESGVSVPAGLLADLEGILGKRFTIGEMRALFDEPDLDYPDNASLSNARFSIRPYSHLGYAMDLWKIAGFAIKVTYTDPRDHQGSARIEVATDSGFSTVVYRETRYGRGRAFAIPAYKLSGGTTYYVRAYRTNDVLASPEESSASTTVSFTTMPTATAELFHGDRLERFVVHVLGWGYWVDTARCRRRIGGASDTNFIYQVPLIRSELPTDNWWIDGVEEDGRDADYTEVFSIADLEATAATFYFDERALETTSEGVPTLYLHTSAGTAVTGVAGNGEHGVVVTLAHPVSDAEGVRCGPGNRYVADALVKSHPGVTTSIKGQAGEQYATHTGSLVMGNDGRFDDWFAKSDPLGNVTSGLLAYRRPIETAMVGRGTRWEERASLAAGIFDPGKPLHRPDEVSLSVGSRQKLDEGERYAADVIDEDNSPSINNSSNGAPDASGQPVPDVIGAANGVRAVYIGLRQWRVGPTVQTMSAWYIGGFAQSGSRWTFDPLTHIVTESPIIAGSVGDRTYDCTQAQGSTDTSPPKLALAALRRAGYRESDLLVASFDAIHAGLPSELQDESVMVAEDEANGLEILERLEITGLFHVARRGDRTVLATQMNPRAPDAFTVWLRKSDLRGDLDGALESRGAAKIKYWTLQTSDGAGGNAHTLKQRPGWHRTTADPRTKIRGLEEVETCAGSFLGAIRVLERMPLPETRIVNAVAPPWGALAFPGGTVVIWDDEAMNTDGVFDADLFKVLEADLDVPNAATAVTLKLDHQVRLSDDVRAFR